MKFRYQKFFLGTPDPRKPLVPRPFIPVFLIGPKGKTGSPFYALLDSGADRTLLPADLAPVVGIDDITTGRHEPAMGIGGHAEDIYFHQLKLQVHGDQRRLPTEVGFGTNIFIPLLGRTFFEHFRAVIFHEKQEEVELKV